MSNLAQDAVEDRELDRQGALYGDKAASYFGNARNDIVALLPTDRMEQLRSGHKPAPGTP